LNCKSSVMVEDTHLLQLCPIIFHKDDLAMMILQPKTEKTTPIDPQWNILKSLSPFENLVFQKGDILYDQWKRDGNVYFILKGTVLIWNHQVSSGKETITSVLSNGDFINLENLTGNRMSNEYAVAKSEVKVKVIPLIALTNLIQKSASFSKHILQYTLEKQQELQKRMLCLTRMNSRDRIIHFLTDYVEKVGRTVGYEWVVNHTLTHHEMACFCNTSRQSVTTTLNELRNENLIHFNRRYLLIRDIKKLRE